MKVEKNPLWVIEFDKPNSAVPTAEGKPAFHFLSPEDLAKSSSSTLIDQKAAESLEIIQKLASSDPLTADEVTEKLIDQLNVFFKSFVKASEIDPKEGQIFIDDLNKNLDQLHEWMDDFKKLLDKDDDLSSQDPS